MRHVLTPVLAFHWAALFAVLAVACSMQGGSGLDSAFRLIGLHDPFLFARPALVVTAAIFAVTFAVVAILFIWAMASSFKAAQCGADEAVELIETAFCGAAFVLTMVLVAGAALSFENLLPPIALHLVAIAASYLAVLAERNLPSLAVQKQGPGPRGFAAGAADASFLARLPGRPSIPVGKITP